MHIVEMIIHATDVGDHKLLFDVDATLTDAYCARRIKVRDRVKVAQEIGHREVELVVRAIADFASRIPSD